MKKRKICPIFSLTKAIAAKDPYRPVDELSYLTPCETYCAFFNPVLNLCTISNQRTVWVEDE